MSLQYHVRELIEIGQLTSSVYSKPTFKADYGNLRCVKDSNKSHVGIKENICINTFKKEGICLCIYIVARNQVHLLVKLMRSAVQKNEAGFHSC